MESRKQTLGSKSKRVTCQLNDTISPSGHRVSAALGSRVTRPAINPGDRTTFRIILSLHPTWRVHGHETDSTVIIKISRISEPCGGRAGRTRSNTAHRVPFYPTRFPGNRRREISLPIADAFSRRRDRRRTIRRELANINDVQPNGISRVNVFSFPLFPLSPSLRNDGIFS